MAMYTSPFHYLKLEIGVSPKCYPDMYKLTCENQNVIGWGETPVAMPPEIAPLPEICTRVVTVKYTVMPLNFLIILASENLQV